MSNCSEMSFFICWYIGLDRFFQKQAVVHVHGQNRWQRTCGVVFREHRTCASLIRQCHWTSQRPASSQVPQAWCVRQTVRAFPNLQQSRTYQGSPPIAGRSKCLTSHTQTRRMRHCNLYGNQGCDWTLCPVRPNLRLQAARNLNTTPLWL